MNRQYKKKIDNQVDRLQLSILTCNILREKNITVKNKEDKFKTKNTFPLTK